MQQVNPKKSNSDLNFTLLYASMANLYAKLTANRQEAAAPKEFLILTAALGWTPAKKNNDRTSATKKESG